MVRRSLSTAVTAEPSISLEAGDPADQDTGMNCAHLSHESIAADAADSVDFVDQVSSAAIQGQIR